MAKKINSLTELASKLGVSTMTVSRVINNSGSVKEETRVRTLEALREYGYRKDVFASINAAKRKGIVTKPHITINFPLRFLSEGPMFGFHSLINLTIQEFLCCHNCTCLQVNMDEHFDSGINSIISSDAIIFCGQISDTCKNAVTSLNQSALTVSVASNTTAQFMVNPNDYEGGNLAAEHLIARNHRHVAIFSSLDVWGFRVRIESFRKRFFELCPNGRVDLIDYKKDFDDESQRQVLSNYFTGTKELATALFVPNGHDTIIADRFLARQKRRIPQDIGLLGYDDIKAFDYLDHSLSRIVFPIPNLGIMAAEVLLKNLHNPDILEPKSYFIDSQLLDNNTVIDRLKMKE